MASGGRLLPCQQLGKHICSMKRLPCFCSKPILIPNWRINKGNRRRRHAGCVSREWMLSYRGEGALAYKAFYNFWRLVLGVHLLWFNFILDLNSFLVPRPHYCARPMRFRPRGRSEFFSPSRSSRIGKCNMMNVKRELKLNRGIKLKHNTSMHAFIHTMVKHRSDLSAFLPTECKMIDLKYIN